MTDEQFKNLCIVYGFAPSRSLRELLDSATAQAVISEREACAALIENADLGGLAEYPSWQRFTADLLTGVVAAIRARGQS
jgi:hypothetical protein